MSEMSNENQETIADIVRGMRRLADEAERGDCYDLRALSTDSFRGYADLIEKAVKHQFRDTTKMIPEEVAVSKMETTTPTCEKSSQVGNAAAMREALDKLLGLFDSGLVEYSDSCDNSDTAQIQYVIDKAGEALEKPPRNCDRYRTAEEAYAGFEEFCVNNSCVECRLCNRGITCSAAWLYEEYGKEKRNEQK